MNIAYRRMTVKDVPQVHRLEDETFAQPWSLQSFLDEMERNVCARYIVALDGDRVVGYAGAWLVLDEGHVTNVAVDKAYRGLRIGAGLMEALMQYASNMGVSYLTLEVRRSNLIAQKLYRSMGFIELGVRKRYYEDNGEDALLWVCQNLPPAQEDFIEA